MRTLDFTDPNHNMRYEICYQSLVLSQKQLAMDQWDTAVDLVRKFKAAGKINGSAGDIELRESTQQVVRLEEAEFRLLIDLIEQPVWRISGLEYVVDTRQWLKTLHVEHPTMSLT